MYPQITLPDQSGMLRLCPDLAAEIGQDESIILLQIDYLCQAARTDNRIHNYQDDHWWTYQTVKDWQKKWLKWTSAKSVERKLKHLENLGYIITGNFNKLGRDRTIWYRPNYDKLAKLKAVKVMNYDPPTIPDEPEIPIPTNCLNGQNDRMQVDNLSAALPKTPTKTPIKEEEEAVDINLIKVSSLHENTFPGLINGLTSDWIKDIIKDHPMSWIEDAYKAAALNRARAPSYIDAILKKWGEIGGPQNDTPKGKSSGHSNNSKPSKAKHDSERQHRQKTFNPFTGQTEFVTY